MVAGIGNDIIEVARIEKALLKESFVKKCFTYGELEYLKGKKLNPQTAAGIFSAKEAVSKAIGTGFRGFMPQDIEICHDEYGRPYVRLSERAEKAASERNISNIHVTVSHCSGYACAYALAETL
ncbi:holo-ACP synthase [Lachnospiraceae bacterium NSJ-143]|nr:holo-ACP synthase [Lachnospiraceae bacterium NSJ-143]